MTHGRKLASSTISVTAGSHPAEITWSLSCGGAVIVSGGAPYSGSAIAPNGASCVLTVADSYGDGWNGAAWQGFGYGPVTLNNGASGTATFTAPSSASCSDSVTWTDMYGDGCSWYETNDPGCTIYANVGQYENCKSTCNTCSVSSACICDEWWEWPYGSGSISYGCSNPDNDVNGPWCHLPDCACASANAFSDSPTECWSYCTALSPPPPSPPSPSPPPPSIPPSPLGPMCPCPESRRLEETTSPATWLGDMTSKSEEWAARSARAKRTNKTMTTPPTKTTTSERVVATPRATQVPTTAKKALHASVPDLGAPQPKASSRRLHADGSVKHVHHKESGVLRDHHRAHGHWCDTHDEEDEHGGAGAAAAAAHHRALQFGSAAGTSPADCTRHFNNPRTVYDPYVDGNLYTIRVVVHAITASDGVTGRLNDTCLTSGISMLNADFRPSASAAGGQRSADTGIQFALATTDPSGNPTSGLVRHASSAWYTQKHDTGGFWTAAWDQSRYMNIFLKSFDDTTLGYAKFPFSLPASDDGFVMRADRWGACTLTDDDGTTASHEIGHYVGLSHTFSPNDGIDEGTGNTADGDCPPRVRPYCSVTGDLICDTNPEGITHYGCAATSSCGTADPIANYMSYADGSCMSLFTVEQARRMRCALVGYRPLVYTTSAMPPAPPTPATSFSLPTAVEATPCVCKQTWDWGGSCVGQNGCTTAAACSLTGRIDSPLGWCLVHNPGCATAQSDGCGSAGLCWSTCNTTDSTPLNACVNDGNWARSITIGGVVSSLTCAWFHENDVGCVKYNDYGQRAACPLECGTCVSAPPPPAANVSPPPPSPPPHLALSGDACACATLWMYAGAAYSGCPETPPDSDPSGSWCAVATDNCATSQAPNYDWSYCSPALAGAGAVDGMCPCVPPPAYPPGTATTIIVRMSMTAEGSVSDYGLEERVRLMGYIALVADVPIGSVSVSITAASVNIQADIEASTAEEASTLETTLTSQLSDATAASALLRITVLTAPTIDVAVVLESPPPPPSPPPLLSPPPAPPPPVNNNVNNNMPIIIAAAAGVVVILCCVGLIVWRMNRKKAGAKATTTSTAGGSELAKV